jgi:hypothetical protein
MELDMAGREWLARGLKRLREEVGTVTAPRWMGAYGLVAGLLFLGYAVALWTGRADPGRRQWSRFEEVLFALPCMLVGPAVLLYSLHVLLAKRERKP